MFRNWQSIPFFILDTHTSIISIDKIKKGQLPDESENFLASIVVNRNGNYDRKLYINAEFVLLVP